MDASGKDTLRLTPSNTRTAILFVAMLIWFLLGASRYIAVGGLLMLGLAAVGLAGAVVYGVMLLPNSSYLEATADGLTISSAFRKRSYTWSAIRAIYVDTILSKQVVKYEIAVAHTPDMPETPDTAEAATEPRDGPARTRKETLPDTYGLPAQELADQLDAIRRRAALPRT